MLKSLTHLSQLKHLNLSRNHLKDPFISKLVPILQKIKLEFLDLSAMNMHDEGFSALCPYLEFNNNLKTLILDYNKL